MIRTRVYWLVQFLIVFIASAYHLRASIFISRHHRTALYCIVLSSHCCDSHPIESYQVHRKLTWTPIQKVAKLDISHVYDRHGHVSTYRLSRSKQACLRSNFFAALLNGPCRHMYKKLFTDVLLKKIQIAVNASIDVLSFFRTLETVSSTTL